MFRPFTVQKNCSTDLKNFANSGPSASNLKVFLNHKNKFFLTLGQNNFNTKYNMIMQLHIFLAPLWLLPTRIAYLNWKLQSFSAITKPLKLCTHCCFSGWFISFFHVNYVDKYCKFSIFSKTKSAFSFFYFFLFSCRKGSRNWFIIYSLFFFVRV